MKVMFTVILYLLFQTNRTFGQKVLRSQIDGLNFKVIRYKDESLSIFKNARKIIHLKSSDLYFEDFDKLEFLDFNGDGFKDLMIKYRSNVPDRSDLFLYDDRLSSGN